MTVNDAMMPTPTADQPRMLRVTGGTFIGEKMFLEEFKELLKINQG